MLAIAGRTRASFSYIYIYIVVISLNFIIHTFHFHSPSASIIYSEIDITRSVITGCVVKYFYSHAHTERNVLEHSSAEYEVYLCETKFVRVK